jgi:membrane protease YdiL (CAAX protease family)
VDRYASAVMDRIRAWLAAAPDYPADPGDRREFDLFGLRLPLRATMAITVVTFALLFDHARTFLPDDMVALGRAPEAMRVVAVERLVLFALVPLLVILLGFRDRPTRYGLTLGDWRTGIALMLLGSAVMTPIVLWNASLPDVQVFYAASAEPLPSLLLTNTMDLAASEFLFRGFVMLTLVRAIGPIGVLVATMPFVFAHLGKPELELFSTLGGGLVYGWLAWRTASIVWGTIAHVYILSLAIVLAGAAR